MKNIIQLLVLILLFCACSESHKKQFKYSGGSLKMALNNQPTTYALRNVADYYSATVLYQISEGLVGIDPKTLNTIPKIASKWSQSDDGKTYTFTIRKGVLFHEHEVFKSEEDRMLTTDDVLHSFNLACSKNENQTSPQSYKLVLKSLLKGAEEFHDGKAKSISGMRAEGETITFELLNADKNFLKKLANVYCFISSKKVYDGGFINDVVGTGPFEYSVFTDGDTPMLTLLKNTDYYEFDTDGNALPYLDSLVFAFQSRKMVQLEMFEDGTTDLITGLPTNRITRMIEGKIQDFNSKPPKLILANNPLLQSHYYFFNMQDVRFKDPLVRKAFNYAIDKKSIGRDVLRNQYYDMGYYGITPPIAKVLKGYDFQSIKDVGYSYNPQLAKKLLEQAGYPNGEGFGTVELRYNINDIKSAVADEFAKQIFKVLRINVNIDGSDFERLTQDATIGKGDIFSQGWAADFPSPETFLMNYHSQFIPEDSTAPSTINKGKYRNYLFDKFYDEAVNSEKMSDQMDNFSKAEVELMKDPPIIPLWYAGDIQITQSYIRGLHFNALEFYDFKNVYIKEWTIEEYKENYNKTQN